MAGVAAVGVFNIVAGVFGALGLVSFATSFVPKPPLAVTQVTVAVGQSVDSPGLTLEGNIPTIKAFAIDGRQVGVALGDSKKTWPAGSVNQVPIKNDKGVENVQSEYVAVYADQGTDELCISAIGLKNPNDDASYGWTGDIGASCGMAWHWSETIVGNSGNSAAYRPICVWITGKDSKNGVNVQGFSMHIIDFSKVTDARRLQYERNNRLMCDSPPRFSAWSSIFSNVNPPFFIPPLQYSPTDGADVDPAAVLVPGVDKTDYNPKEGFLGKAGNIEKPIRQPFTPPPPPPSPPPPAPAPPAPAPPAPAPVPAPAPAPAPPVEFPPLPPPLFSPFPSAPKAKRGQNAGYRLPGTNMTSMLISSSHPEHSARQLCESTTSWGPDAVSETESLFCDMDEKRLWPLCSEKEKTACFDTKSNAVRTAGMRGTSNRVIIPVKQYGMVKRWGAKA